MKSKKNYLIIACVIFLMLATVSSIAINVFLIVDNITLASNIVFLLVVAVTIFFVVILYFMIEKEYTKPLGELEEVLDRMLKGKFDSTIETSRTYGNYTNLDEIKLKINKLNAELLKNESHRNDFISNVSHEIKNPLFFISNNLKLLSKCTNEEEKEKYIEAMQIGVNRLNSLVENVLKLNKIENQELKLEKERCNLSLYTSELILDFIDKIEEKNIKLITNLDDIVCDINIGMYELIFNNLLSNAIKFTNEYGTISIELKSDKNRFYITVSDDGIGMDSKTGAQIFDKFYQGDTSHQKEGNGLGLTLVKRIVDILGGEISVTSELGKGSTFKIGINR